jgi:hypothetical protein
MKPTPQLKQGSTAVATVNQDDPSQSGIRPALHPEQCGKPSASARTADVTVVFRGVLPMERLVQLIRRRAEEAAPASALRVEVEPLPEGQQWRVRLQTDSGEFAASEPGPFLAVTRAFSMLQ